MTLPPCGANSAKIRPTNNPSQMPDRAPPRSTRPHVRRPVMRSSCLRSVPTMRQFSTGNSLSDKVSTSFWASSYLSKVPSDIGYSRDSRARTWLRPRGCVLMPVIIANPARAPGTWSSPRGVVLQEPPADDHPLDVGGSLADEEHGGLAVEPFDLVLLRVPVPAVDPEGVLHHLGADLGRQVLGHTGLEIAPLTGVLEPGRLDHHLV